MKRQDFLKKHQIRSKLQEEKVRKKLVAEEEEKLNVLGQDSEHQAVKPITEEAKKAEKAEDERQAKELEIFTKARRTSKDYIRTLIFSLHRLVNEIQMPKGYQWGVWYDGKGVRLTIKDKFNKIHQRAFKPSFSPKYDQHAMLDFAVWAEDIFDLVEGNLQSGIWTPRKSNPN